MRKLGLGIHGFLPQLLDILMLKHFQILFFTVVLLFLQPSYADVIIGNGNIERLNSGVIKDINCQNYTISSGGLLDTSSGGTLREVTKFTINGTWDFGSGKVKELGAWENDGNVTGKPTQTGAIHNLQFTTLCGPISVLGTSDTDGDGISDADEGDNAVALGHGIALDQDGDGIYNFLDNDSDGDGLSDAAEGGNNIDTDGDGIPDYLDGSDSRPKNNNDDSITGNTLGDDVTIDILANDTLNNGQVPAAADVNVTLIAPPGGVHNADGSVGMPGEGVWSYDATTGMLTFNPLRGYTGDPTPIEYTITEIATGLTSEPATVRVRYDDAIASPKADDDNSTGNEIGDDARIDILDGDILGNGSPATPSDVRVTLVTPAHGTLNPDGSLTVSGEGIWSYDGATGILTFRPLSGFEGSPTSIEYVLTEITTGLTSRAEVTVEYDVMTRAVDDDKIIVDHYGTITIDVLANDQYSGNVVLTITQQPTYGTLEIIIDSDGTPLVLYHSPEDINGVVDSFEYSITDAHNNTSRAIVTLSIQCTSSQVSDGVRLFGGFAFWLMMISVLMMGLYVGRRDDTNRG